MDITTPEATKDFDGYLPQKENKNKGNKLAKIFLWIIVLLILLIFILWILNSWLGYCLAFVYYEFDFLDRPSYWALSNSPIWLVGKGLLKYKKGDIFPFTQKSAPEFLFKYLNHNSIDIRARAWHFMNGCATYAHENIPKKEFYYHIIEALNNNNKYFNNLVLLTFWGYSNAVNDNCLITLCYLNKYIELEKNKKVRGDLQKINNFLEGERITEKFNNEEVEYNIKLLIKVSRNYHQPKPDD